MQVKKTGFQAFAFSRIHLVPLQHGAAAESRSPRVAGRPYARRAFFRREVRPRDDLPVVRLAELPPVRVQVGLSLPGVRLATYHTISYRRLSFVGVLTLNVKP
jgi:hypothetical protein